MVVARVVSIDAIEGADKIRRIGSMTETGPVEVVCGAWNFEVGDRVALAPVGAVLPGGVTIRRQKMKGVKSNGMLCSAGELHLSDDHEGIMVLNEHRRGGTRPAADRGAVDRTRRGVRHRRGGEPPRCLERGRGGPRPGGAPGPALCLPGRPDGGRAARAGSRGPGHGGGGRPRAVPPLQRPGGDRGPAGSLAGLVGPTAVVGRHAAHQQRGRRVQLRDAGARPAHPPLRPRPSGRWGTGGQTGPAG